MKLSKVRIGEKVWCGPGTRVAEVPGPDLPYIPSYPERIAMGMTGWPVAHRPGRVFTVADLVMLPEDPDWPDVVAAGSRPGEYAFKRRVAGHFYRYGWVEAIGVPYGRTANGLIVGFPDRTRGIIPLTVYLSALRSDAQFIADLKQSAAEQAVRLAHIAEFNYIAAGVDAGIEAIERFLLGEAADD